RRALVFDMEVCAIRRDVTRAGADGLSLLGGPDALDEVMRRADYLAVTLSLNDQTRGLIGARELALMKPTARLINVARAEIIDEDALYRALADGRLADAALDVWYRYPKEPGPTLPARRPFHELDNVLMTPHVFGWERGLTAGAFSFGFLVSAFLSPLVGRLMDRRGPRFVIEMGAVVMAIGLLLAPFVSRPWHLYATLGVLVGGGGNCLGYTGQ